MNKILSSLVIFLATFSVLGDVKENYTKYCAVCHAKDGSGNTKAGKMVGVKDFQNPKSYSSSLTNDANAQKLIKEGVKDKSGKELMKPFANKLTDDEIIELFHYVKMFKK